MTTLKDVLESAAFTNEVYDVYSIKNPNDRYYTLVEHNLSFRDLYDSKYWNMIYCGMDCTIEKDGQSIRIKLYVEP